MLASVTSATLVGVDGQLVTVEVHIARGLPSYHVVGLPDAAVRESRERVRAAVLSSGLAWPQQRITVNLCKTQSARPRQGPSREASLVLKVPERRRHSRCRAERRFWEAQSDALE